MVAFLLEAVACRSLAVKKERRGEGHNKRPEQVDCAAAWRIEHVSPPVTLSSSSGGLGVFFRSFE